MQIVHYCIQKRSLTFWRALPCNVEVHTVSTLIRHYFFSDENFENKDTPNNLLQLLEAIIRDKSESKFSRTHFLSFIDPDEGDSAKYSPK